MISLVTEEKPNLRISNDQAIFEEFVKIHSNMVFNTSLNFLGNKEDAEEIAQDVFVKVYDKIDTFRNDSSVKTWLYRITINCCLEHQRKLKRKKRWANIFSISQNNVEDIDKAALNHPGIDDSQKDDYHELYQQINLLPENQKVAFTLHKLDGLSYKEISETMELSISSVESLIFRARKKLKSKLTIYYGKM